jgi:hypothetical protein
MKTFLLSAVSLSIALAGIVQAENQDEVKPPKNRNKATQPAKTVTPVGPRISPKTVQTNQYHQKVRPTARTYTPPVMPKTYMPRTYTKTPADTNVRNKNLEKKNWQNNYSQNNSYKPTPQKKNWQNSKNPNTTVPNRNWHNNNNQKTTVQKKNWQNHNNTWNNNSWADARRRHHRDHHDRNWWRSRYSRFALFGSGFYFWDGGYWFPAYGYDPGYNTYSYDEPIYGYNDLDPAQVIANVQTELQRLGYYRYAVDGTMGPATRAAIANYQRDRGLSITSAIDGPTLQSLGLG